MYKKITIILFIYLIPLICYLWSQVYLPISLEVNNGNYSLNINNQNFDLGILSSSITEKPSFVSQVDLSSGTDGYFLWRYPIRGQSYKIENNKVILINPEQFEVRFYDRKSDISVKISGLPTLTPYENIGIKVTKSEENLLDNPYAIGFTLEQKIKNVARLLLKNYLFAVLLISICLVIKRTVKLPNKLKTKLKITSKKVITINKFTFFFIILISLAGLISGLVVHNKILGAIPHSKEEVLYLFQARTFSMGKIYVNSHPLKEFFDFEYMINDGKWYSKEPPGASILYAFGMLLGQPEIINPLLFMLAIIMVFYLGKICYGLYEGLIASILMAISPTLILFSANYFADIPVVAFRIFFVFSFIVFTKKWDRKIGLLSGSLLSFNLLIRPYDTLFFTIPLVVYFLSCFFPKPTKTRLKSMVFFLSAAFFIGSFYFIYNGLLTGNPVKPTQVVYSKYDFPGFGPRGVEWPIEFGIEEALKNLYFNLLSTAKVLWGWPEFVTFSFVFVALILNYKNKYNWLFLGIILANIIAYFFYHHHGNIYGPRYFVATFFAFSLISARGLTVLFLSKRNSISNYLLFFVVTLLVFYTIKFNINYLPKYKNFNGMSRDILDIAAKKIEKPALVFIPAKNAWWDYGIFFWTFAPNLNSDIVYALDQSVYHLTPYHPEWQRKVWRNEDLMRSFPGRNYYRLESNQFKRL